MPQFHRRSFLLLAAASAAAAPQTLLTPSIRTPKQWDTRRRQILQAMQAVMGPLPPHTGTPRFTITREHQDGPILRQHIRYEAESEDWVPAWLLLPKSPRRNPAPAVLCLHQTTRIGKDEPAGLGGKPNLHYARELAERGFITLAPDYPNFGEYTFDPYAKGYLSATMKGILNHIRAVSLLHSLPAVRKQSIAVCGHSLGGHNSLFLAAFDPRVKAAITSCGFTAFPKYYGGDLTGWSHKGYMPRIASIYGKSPAKMPFDFPEVLAAIAPRAIFINAPLHDANFEVTGVRDSVQLAREVFERIYRSPTALQAEYPDATHDFPPDVRLRAYAFLDRVL